MKNFTAKVEKDSRGRAFINVPFDPDEIWSKKPRHHVSGTIAGNRWRGIIAKSDSGFGMVIGQAWIRDCPVSIGDKVKVSITPEGPQRDDLAPDVAAALKSEPKAAAFFDGLAQFYRKGYLRWIDATKRSPELRAERIAEMVKLLKAGVKERPR
jgi:hypothetical protein